MFRSQRINTQMAHYPLTLTPDGVTLLVTCALLPEVTTWAETRADAAANGRSAVLEALAARIDAGQPIPAGLPTTELSQPMAYISDSVAAKLDLHRAMLESGVDRSELTRLMCAATQMAVDDLLKLDHESTKAQLETALAAMGYDGSRANPPHAE